MKQIQKKVVPSREERLEQIGDPKAPKMGGITPTKVELPEVDDLLDKMKKAAPQNLIGPDLINFRNLFIGDSEQPYQPCSIGCQCLPCLRGDCYNHIVSNRR